MLQVRRQSKEVTAEGGSGRLILLMQRTNFFSYPKKAYTPFSGRQAPKKFTPFFRSPPIPSICKILKLCRFGILSNSAKCLSTLRPNQLTWAVSLTVDCCHTHCSMTGLPSPKVDRQFTIPCMVKVSWSSTAMRMCSPLPNLSIAVVYVINKLPTGGIDLGSQTCGQAYYQ